jgi:hypothetical protein
VSAAVNEVCDARSRAVRRVRMGFIDRVELL